MVREERSRRIPAVTDVEGGPTTPFDFESATPTSVGAFPDAGPRVPSHARAQRSLTSSARAALLAFWQANKRAALVAALGTIGLRLITEWIGLVNQFGITFPHQVARHPSLLSQVWGHWDAGYYITIAQYGYAGRTIGHGQVANEIAFAPLYPWGIRLVHGLTPLNYLASAELLSALALFVALVAVYRLVTLDGAGKGDGGVGSAGTTVILLLAFPTAFFLLAPYPESLTLALVALSFLAARRGQWLLAGLLAAGVALTKYYMALLIVALAVELWQQRRTGVSLEGEPEPDPWSRDALRLGAAAVPTIAAMVAWIIYQKEHIGSGLAFLHVQSVFWHRHLAGPWTLFANTITELRHWTFLDTPHGSVTILIDFVTVLLLAAVTVYVFLRVRPSYGVLLGLAWCVYTFETMLLSVTREVLVLFPLFLGLGLWAAGHPWRERVLLVLFLPCSYYLTQRFVTGAFAG